MDIFIKFIFFCVITFIIYKLFKRKKRKEFEQFSKTIKITDQTIFVFDINGVIIQPDYKAIISIAKKILRCCKLKLLSTFIHPGFYYIILQKFLQKAYTSEQVLFKIMEKYPTYNQLALYGFEISNAQKPVPGSFEIVKKLKKKGYTLLILSNLSEDKFPFLNKSSIEYLSQKFSIFDNFDYDASLFTTKKNNFIRKPYLEYYENFKNKFIKKYGTERLKDIIFIDDRLENVISARKKNLNSIWFTSAKNLSNILKKYGLYDFYT